MERAYDMWTTLCLPAQIYPIVMAGIILFDIYKGVYVRGVTNFVMLLVGTALLWVLCAAKFEFVAYSLLALPVIFTVFLLAIIVFDQTLLSVTHKYNAKAAGANGCSSCSGGCSGGCE